MNNQWLMIKQMDKQLKEWQEIGKKYGAPRMGWIKTLRTALSMTVEQLATRLNLSRARIAQLENAEINDAVTLRSLREAANAMDCELIYAIVPKNHSTLESIIKARAAQVAKERVARVAHSMSLEAQSVDEGLLKKQEGELSNLLTIRLNKKLWSAHKKTPLKVKKIIEHLAKKK
jgi:predicted DNA-binding mobile mystery protein A